jgi:hypothetical protein
MDADGTLVRVERAVTQQMEARWRPCARAIVGQLRRRHEWLHCARGELDAHLGGGGLLGLDLEALLLLRDLVLLALTPLGLLAHLREYVSKYVSALSSQYVSR